MNSSIRENIMVTRKIDNIMLRNDFDGVEVSAGAGLPTRKGMDSRNGSALWGGAPGPGI